MSPRVGWLTDDFEPSSVTDHMIRATRVAPQAAAISAVIDQVVLDFDQRHRRRIAMVGSGGTRFLLDLEKAARLRGGDVLLLEDGRRIAVIAAKEPLAAITADDPSALVRIAWHIGNRHLPAMLQSGSIVIRRDHVIEEMVVGLGGVIEPIDAAFDPEAGAYAGGAGHHHHHHHHGDDEHGH